MRRLIGLFIFMCFLLLVGCNEDEQDVQWQSSKEEGAALLSVEEFENDTIVFLDFDGY